MATIRQARAAIIKGAELAGWPKPGGSGVAEMMRGLGRILRGPQRQAAPLHAEALAAIRATAFTRRRTRGGHTETAEYAERRGLVDVALASVMRDGLLRVSGAAALRWGDVELAGDGCGLRPPRADDGGLVEVSQDAGPLHGAPGSRTGCGGQVLPGRQGVEARRRSPGKRASAR